MQRCKKTKKKCEINCALTATLENEVLERNN